MQLRRALLVPELGQLRRALTPPPTGRHPTATQSPAHARPPTRPQFRYDLSKGLRPRRSVRTAMAHEVLMYSIVQKEGLGLDKAIEEVKHRCAAVPQPQPRPRTPTPKLALTRVCLACAA